MPRRIPVTAARRPNSRALLLDLTRRLAEDYDALPGSTVTTTVRAAVAATALFGEDVASSIETIERIAREDLGAVLEAAAGEAQITLAG
jgi:hypothetical protein